MLFYTWWDCRYVVGLSIVGVELAVLLAYREHLSARHVVGLLMCLGGLVLAARP